MWINDSLLIFVDLGMVCLIYCLCKRIVVKSMIEQQEFELIEVLDKYSYGLELLDCYDHQTLKIPKGAPTTYKLEYAEARSIIDSMSFNDSSTIFGKEKANGCLEGILLTIYQDVFGKELYPTTQEKAANLLYFLVKDHPFVDGCKRIAATLFLEFLNKNHALIKGGNLIIDNKTLAAITILTAESNPNEKEMIVKLIMNLLD